MNHDTRSGETIDFDTSLDGGTILLTLGELSITKAMTVDATFLGNGLTIDASGGSRIFNINDGNDEIDSPVAISGLTLTGGSDGDGGAIRAGESLTITASMITGNWAVDGGGIWTSDSLTVAFSTIMCNAANMWNVGGSGGGILAGGNVTVIFSTISGNRAGGDIGGSGGGIFASGNVTVASSMIVGNSIRGGLGFTGGGGILAHGSVTVTSSTIAGNSVRGRTAIGGGIGAEDVTPFVAAVLAGALDAAADINADGGVNGLDVTPFVATVLSGGGVAGAGEPRAVQRAVGVAAPASDGIDDGKRFTDRNNAERTFPMGAQIRSRDGCDERRPHRERMLRPAQHAGLADWQVAVDDALGGDTDWTG